MDFHCSGVTNYYQYYGFINCVDIGNQLTTRKEIRKLTFRKLCGLYTDRWSYAISWCMVT